MNPPPDDLDALFARARRMTAEDLAATERVVTHFRAARRHARVRWVGAWLAPLVASAAVAAGVLFVQARELPTSAAYDVYQQVSGSGW